MLYIMTVHYKTNKWIDIQLKYISKHIHEPYRIFACLNNIDKKFFSRFYYAEDIEGTHESKLEFLADKVISKSEDDDILIFLDGDAFPISDEIIPYVRKKIREHRLIAIKRYENLGDIQPHPAFCATTVNFWKKYRCDWGYNSDVSWKNLLGKKTSDVGGNLLKILNNNNVSWKSMFRSNKKNLHPLWFGIYDDMIYHHGAGFRNAKCRLDTSTSFQWRVLYKIRSYKASSNFFLFKIMHFMANILIKLWLLKKNILVEKIYFEICKNDDFYKMFI